jgi:putative transposase
MQTARTWEDFTQRATIESICSLGIAFRRTSEASGRWGESFSSQPTAEWVVQQLRETFPEAGPYRYVILDRDAKLDAEVVAFLQGTGLKPKRTSIRPPWQNGIAERWVGSCRRKLLDHVIPLNEQHLRRLVRDHRAYYQEDRIHDALGKDTPNLRPVEKKPSAETRVISNARLVTGRVPAYQ